MSEPDVEISSDGRTVWVNSPVGGAIGRLGPHGIDVHSPDNTACLDCGEVGENKREAWERFKAGMLGHHGVTVPEKYRPRWVG